MNYENCVVIRTSVSVSWLIKFGDGRQKLLIVDKGLTVLNIIDMIKVRNPNKKFSIQTITVGEFNLDRKVPTDHSFCLDGRSVNQDMDVKIEI